MNKNSTQQQREIHSKCGNRKFCEDCQLGWMGKLQKNHTLTQRKK